MGFRYFDTAPYYTNSEFVLGEFISGVPRESIFVATKFNLAKNLSPRQASEHVRKSLAESLRRLKTDTIDLFQVHDVSNLENVLAEEGALDVLRQARQEGVIRYFGLATRWHNLLSHAAQHGEFDTVLTYSDYTPFNQSAEPVITLADGQGVGVINASPLAGSRERKLDLKDSRVLGAVLAFPLQNPGIDINLTGPANSLEVRSSVAALNHEVDKTLWDEWGNKKFSYVFARFAKH